MLEVILVVVTLALAGCTGGGLPIDDPPDMGAADLHCVPPLPPWGDCPPRFVPR